MLNNQAALYMVMGKQDKVEESVGEVSAIYKSNFRRSERCVRTIDQRSSESFIE
jgi:hypothetical protein